MGVTSALVFANLGAAYGTAKSGVGIASMGAAERMFSGERCLLLFKNVICGVKTWTEGDGSWWKLWVFCVFKCYLYVFKLLLFFVKFFSKLFFSFVMFIGNWCFFWTRGLQPPTSWICMTSVCTCIPSWPDGTSVGYHVFKTIRCFWLSDKNRHSLHTAISASCCTSNADSCALPCVLFFQ